MVYRYDANALGLEPECSCIDLMLVAYAHTRRPFSTTEVVFDYSKQSDKMARLFT